MCYGRACAGRESCEGPAQPSGEAVCALLRLVTHHQSLQTWLGFSEQCESNRKSGSRGSDGARISSWHQASGTPGTQQCFPSTLPTLCRGSLRVREERRRRATATGAPEERGGMRLRKGRKSINWKWIEGRLIMFIQKKTIKKVIVGGRGKKN